MKISIDGGRLVVESGNLISKKTDEIPIPEIKKITQERQLLLKTWTVHTTKGRWYKMPSNRHNDSIISQLRAIIDGQSQPSYGYPRTPSLNVQLVQPQSPPMNQPQVQKEIQKEVVKIRCAHCRTLNLDSSQFCVNCGARL